MTTTLTPDLCVIGGGAGGYALAVEAAGFGASVVLVDRQGPGGGPLRHAMPMQALLAAAAHAHAMRKGSRFGIADVEPSIDFRALVRQLHKVVAAATPPRSAERLAALGVVVLREEARFLDGRTIQAGDSLIRARHMTIATGCVPVLPAIAGLDEIGFLTPDTILSLARRPGRLIVAGGGPYVLPFAQAWRRLGAEVAVIMPDTALAGDDPEHAAIVLRALRAEGLEIHEHAQAIGTARRGRTGVRVRFEDGAGQEQTIDGTHLLVIPDEAPAIDGLDLDRAGIVAGPAGITVDAGCRTTNRRVHAIGDVTGTGRSVHLAEHQAALVARALFGRRGREAQPAVPRVTFTSPQIAAVGLGEDEARRQHRHIRVLRQPLADSDHARAQHETTGSLKLVTDHRGRILGVSIMVQNAAAMIAPWALAIKKELAVADMAAHMPPYPSAAEIGKRAAISYLERTTRGRGAHRMIRLPRFFR